MSIIKNDQNKKKERMKSEVCLEVESIMVLFSDGYAD